MTKAAKKRPPRLVGWREHADLPDFDLEKIKVKIDTGARTSALGVSHLVITEKNGIVHARFSIPGVSLPRGRIFEIPLVDQRAIRNTSGVPDKRPVIRTTLVIGTFKRIVEVSLADRSAMKFPMIVGRTALKGRRVLVDPARSWHGAKRISPSGTATKSTLAH